METRDRRPDPVDLAITLAGGVERAAAMARAAARMPTGTRALDKARDRAFAAVDQAVAALEQLAQRGHR